MQAELNRYQITCNNEGVTLPKREFLWDKVDAINSLLNHVWTGEEIKARLAKRNEFKRQFDPAERERVARLLDEAVSRGDEEEADKLQQELDKLSKQRLAFKTTLGPSKLTDTAATSSEQDWLAERNRENRRMNAELVRKAQLKEKAKAREVERAISRGEAVPDDRIAHLVKDAMRGLHRALQTRLAQHGVQPGHWVFLRVLWLRDGLTQRELSIAHESARVGAILVRRIASYCERPSRHPHANASRGRHPARSISPAPSSWRGGHGRGVESARREP